jgi:hypothetical protein
MLQEMYDTKTMPKDVVAILRKHGYINGRQTI